MCSTCEYCKTLTVKEALKVIAIEMELSPKKCLDKLVGELIGIQEKKRNTDVETAWERERT